MIGNSSRLYARHLAILAEIDAYLVIARLTSAIHDRPRNVLLLVDGRKQRRFLELGKI